MNCHRKTEQRYKKNPSLKNKKYSSVILNKR